MRGWDFRSMKCVFVPLCCKLRIRVDDSSREGLSNEKAHDDVIRDIDYNPNKPYHVVTSGQLENSLDAN